MKVRRTIKTRYPLFFIALCSSNLTVANDVLVSAQAYYLNKSYSVDKDINTDIMGLYGYIGYDKHSLELGVETASVKNDDISLQEDVVAVYKNYQLSGWQLSLGGHHANVTNATYTYDETTDTVTASPFYYELNALILGAQYSDYQYGFKRWSLGADVISADMTNNIQANLTQFSPHYGYYFPVNNKKHTLYAGIEVHSQFFSQNVQDEDTYISPEITLKYITAKTTYTISGQFGDNINQFSLGGFSYLGDNLLYSSKYNLGIEHSFTPALFAKASYKYQTYLSEAGNDETIKVMHISLGYNF